MSADALRQSIARKFVRASELEQRGASPLYERLSLGIAQDPALLTIAAEGRRDQPLPNLFFAAVHMLLLSGVRHELAKFYPSVTGNPSTAEEPFLSLSQLLPGTCRADQTHHCRAARTDQCS